MYKMLKCYRIECDRKIVFLEKDSFKDAEIENICFFPLAWGLLKAFSLEKRGDY